MPYCFSYSDWASEDGRFILRLFGNDETTASELYYPDIGGVINEVVREYTFSSGGKTFTCSFTRRLKDPNVTDVYFRLDVDGRDLVYIDFDADGRWDKFVDYTQEPPKSHERDGLRWKECPKYEDPSSPDNSEHLEGTSKAE